MKTEDLKTSGDYLSKYRLVLRWDGIDLEEAKRIGKEVIHNGSLVSYYIEDGYDSFSGHTSLSRGNFSNAFRIAGVVSFLNPDVEVDILFKYMNLLCIEFFDTKELIADRGVILDNINNIRNGLYDISPVTKKFFWVKPYDKIGKKDREIDGKLYDGKSKVVMSHYNKSKRIESIHNIEKAIDLLIELGNDDNTFLTIKDISKVSMVSESTVKRLYFMFKKDIDNYNYSMFSTYSYQEFIKGCNVLKITHAISSFKEDLENKLTKRSVSKKSELHINTVYNLWEEDDIQNSLDEYNRWSKQIKQLNK
jgi:hypothetical protein